MADYDSTDSALIGHFITVRLLAKLVDTGVISPADAIEVLDDVLLQFEEWQALFPDALPSFESARKFLSESLAGYQAMLKGPPD
jgi:hypothetical protein